MLVDPLNAPVVPLGDDVVLVMQGERSGVAARDVGHLRGCIAAADTEDGSGLVQGSHERAWMRSQSLGATSWAGRPPANHPIGTATRTGLWC